MADTIDLYFFRRGASEVLIMQNLDISNKFWLYRIVERLFPKVQDTVKQNIAIGKYHETYFTEDRKILYYYVPNDIHTQDYDTTHIWKSVLEYPNDPILVQLLVYMKKSGKYMNNAILKVLSFYTADIALVGGGATLSLLSYLLWRKLGNKSK
jgi:hypothetical protein